MFVFPRKKENPLLMDDAPPGSFAAHHESGWINKETFLVWFKKFIEHSNPGPKKPMLLIIDATTLILKACNSSILLGQIMLCCYAFPRIRHIGCSHSMCLSWHL
ncbi:hypothetical protein AVEN_12420-1 [Araneus ventricosus]|uniref:DDE-1 domain-containing protein n=1 Tax=Araneus ventricosus TaxID=182803 RepID=A0A4Y2SN08_ARAVE|nr:hypothetical protein AVEN_12420-1 [Araneus ventricosus]